MPCRRALTGSSRSTAFVEAVSGKYIGGAQNEDALVAARTRVISSAVTTISKIQEGGASWRPPVLPAVDFLRTLC